MESLHLQRLPGPSGHLQRRCTNGNRTKLEEPGRGTPYLRRSSNKSGSVLALLERKEVVGNERPALRQHQKNGNLVGKSRILTSSSGAWKKHSRIAHAVPSNRREGLTEEAGGLGPDASREPSGTLVWIRMKWAENRAEYHRLRKVLKDLGLAGFLSYGLFNTAYYLVSFLFVWFFVSPSPSGLGVAAAAQRFLKIFAMVWAGSQVTKLLRAGGALLLAPLVDRGLDWFTTKGKFRSKTQAFWAIVGSCVVLALIVFVVIVSLWA